jgi:hypothetical protein
MPSLSAHAPLDVWERGLSQPPLIRALLLAGLAAPGASWTELASASIGRRDALLLRLREQLFGARMPGVAACPACAERLELSISTTELLAAADEQAPTRPAGEYELDVEGYHLRLRAPASADLLETAGVATEAELLARCVAVDRKGKRLAVERWPAGVRRAAIDSLAAADPLADISLQLVCPACGHTWAVVFDIVDFLWRELEDWAVRTLRDVHDLARAYAWREADILNLSSLRRQLYLEMAYG